MDRPNRVNESQPAQEEPFWVFDHVTGKSRLVREMTDAELERHLKVNRVRVENAWKTFNQSVTTLMQIASMTAVMDYEASRRKHSIITVPP